MFENMSIARLTANGHRPEAASARADFAAAIPRRRTPLRSAWQTILATKSLLAKYAATEPYMEIVYQQLVFRDLRKLGIDDNFYPVGSAASYSLFYIVLRTLMTLPVTSILDIGAGQTSLLLDAAKKALQADIDITTLEHDPSWSDHIRSQIDHPVILAPLKSQVINRRDIYFYDLGAMPTLRPVEFMLIDGPQAFEDDRRFARLGALALVEQLLAEDFIILVDDAERTGEKALIKGIRNLLDIRQINYNEIWFAGAKRQHLFMTDKFSSLLYY